VPLLHPALFQGCELGDDESMTRLPARRRSWPIAGDGFTSLGQVSTGLVALSEGVGGSLEGLMGGHEVAGKGSETSGSGMQK